MQQNTDIDRTSGFLHITIKQDLYFYQQIKILTKKLGKQEPEESKKDNDVILLKNDEDHRMDITVEIMEADKVAWGNQFPPSRKNKKEIIQLLAQRQKDSQLFFHQNQTQNQKEKDKDKDVKKIHVKLKLMDENKERSLIKNDRNIMSFECYTKDKISFKVLVRQNNNKKLEDNSQKYQIGPNIFPIKKITQLPNVTHEVEVKLAKMDMNQQKIQIFGGLYAELIFSKCNFGYLKLKVKQSKIHDPVLKNHSSRKQYIIITCQGKQMRTPVIESDLPVWNFQEKIYMSNFIKKLVFHFYLQNLLDDTKLGICSIDLLKSGLLRATGEIQHHELDIEDIMENYATKKVKIGSLTLESKFIFDFDSP